MSWFLTIFLSVYTAFHALFYCAARLLLPAGAWPRIVLALFLLLMIATPIIAVMAGYGGYQGLARLAGTVGYWWMGFLVYALLCLLALDLLRLITLPFWHQAWNWRLPVALALGAAVLISAYAGYAATDIRIKRVTIPTAKLPAGMDNLIIAQTTDLHLGLTGGVPRLRKAIKLVEQSKADLWVDTGDMWDRPLLDVEQEIAMMSKVNPPLGKYMIAGNHEAYVGLEVCFALSRRAGFTIVENRGVAAGPVYVAGVDDARSVKPEWDAAALAGADAARFTLFLRHRPLFNPAHAGKVDLQLSGHTHGGQMWPFHYVVKNIFTYFVGLYHPAPDTLLYTSRGTGAWGPPMRLFAPPEVTVFQLVRTPK